MFDAEIVAQVIAQSRKERWGYPRVFESLKLAGVRTYEMTLADYQLVYHGVNGQYTEILPTATQPVEMTGEFNPREIELAFQNYQNQKINYAEFLHTIARTGVIKYQVDMEKRTFSYVGANEGEIYVKPVPTPKD